MKYAELKTKNEIKEAFNTSFTKVFLKPEGSESYEVANRSIIGMPSTKDRSVIAVIGSSERVFTPTIADRLVSFEELKMGDVVESMSVRFSGPMGVRIEAVFLEEEGKALEVQFDGQEYPAKKLGSFLTCKEEIILKNARCEGVHLDAVSKVKVGTNFSPKGITKPQVVINDTVMDVKIEFEQMIRAKNSEHSEESEQSEER